ncbi:MAG: sulfatase [Blastochloris sp.]|nr:sulfatase [Blastochloris sp.]
MKKILCALWLALLLHGSVRAEDGSRIRPNIIWLVGDDTGPELGCYGDGYASTPNLDRMASEGALFLRAFCTSPVCAPSRAGLITGMYPTSMGAMHMRSRLAQPPLMFTSLLREAGYKVIWPGKTDFNFDVPEGAFDSTENWTKNPKVLPTGQPFFAYYNFGETHEGVLRNNPKLLAEFTADLKPEQLHDPARAPVPPYHPDTEAVRRQLADYYDTVSGLDFHLGRIWKMLEEQGLAESTVVVFLGDHGRPLPRAKRWVYDSGLRIPLIVRWPSGVKAGTRREDLVSTVDLAPTMLSLAGVKVPETMQGRVFLGEKQGESRSYVFGHRDRMDTTPDRIRCVRDARYKYIRNHEPQRPYAQEIAYIEVLETMKAWRAGQAAGTLNPVQALFFAESKPAEELYDLDQDPHEVSNLAGQPEHEAKLQELRGALDKWTQDFGDLGAVPEEELLSRGVLKEWKPKGS